MKKGGMNSPVATVTSTGLSPQEAAV